MKKYYYSTNVLLSSFNIARQVPITKKDKDLKFLKRINLSAADFFALLILVMNFQQSFALEHFAAPPKGLYKYTLKTYPKQATYQIVGSLSPMSLLINGKLIQLSNSVKSNESGLWINGKEYSTNGANKTFFIEYIQKKQLKNLTVELATGAKRYAYTIKLSSLYLDFPIKQSVYKKTKDEDIGFDIFNQNENELQIDHNGKFKVGNGFITGAWKEKVINLPYEVTREEYSNENIIFALDTEASINQDITGTKIMGLTNPGNKVLLNNEALNVEENGKFFINYIPTQKYETVKFKIISKDKKEFSKSIHFVCPKFDKGYPWYKPTKSKRFIELAIMDEEWSRSPDLNGEQFKSQAHQKIRVSIPIKDRKEFLGISIQEAFNRYDGSQSFQIDRAIEVFYRRIYHQNWGWFYGGDLILQNLKYLRAGANCNFCQDFEQYSLHGQIFGGHRFKLGWNIEWTPQFSFRKSLTSAFFSEMFIFEMLSFRYEY